MKEKGFFINVSEEIFFKLLHAAYCERVGLIVGTSKPAEELCKRFCAWLFGRRQHNSLFIQGGVGTGKTTLVESIFSAVKQASEAGIEHNFYAMIKATALENKDRLEEGLVDYLTDLKGLIIDDMGSEEPTVKVWGSEIRPMERVLKGRSDKMLPTILTTNLNLQQIESQYNSKRLADVLAQYDKLVIDTTKSFRRI